MEAYPKTLEALLKAKDVQRVLNVSLPYVYRLAESGKLKSVQVPAINASGRKHVTRFKKSDVLKFIDNHYLSGE